MKKRSVMGRRRPTNSSSRLQACILCSLTLIFAIFAFSISAYLYYTSSSAQNKIASLLRMNVDIVNETVKDKFSSAFSNIIVNVARWYEEIQRNLTIANRTEARRNQIKLRDMDSGYVVPNIVHFIWFGENRNLTFVNFVSMLSAYKIQKPDTIMFHHDHLPVGHYWERAKREISTLKLVNCSQPQTIYNQTLKETYHKADIARIEIIYKYGGIYIDYDVIIVSSMDPLRRYNFTLGKEKPPKFISGIVVGRKRAPFLKLWYRAYRNDYHGDIWDYNSANKSYELYLQHPELVHVEYTRLTTPDWYDRSLLFDKVINWRDLYVVHLMVHQDHRKDSEPCDIDAPNTTFGQVLRYVYYGSADTRGIYNCTSKPPA